MRGRYVDQWIAIMVLVIASYAAGYWTAVTYLR